MAKIQYKRGTAAELEKEPLKDGLLSFTLDDGKIHLDYSDTDGQVKRKTFYGGVLSFGEYIYDGSKDVSVKIYNGERTEV